VNNFFKMTKKNNPKKLIGFAYMKEYHPEKFLKITREAGRIHYKKCGNKSLLEWQKKHPEQQRKSYNETIKKHPNFAKTGGYACQKKHPEIPQKLNEWKKKNYWALVKGGKVAGNKRSKKQLIKMRKKAKPKYREWYKKNKEKALKICSKGGKACFKKYPSHYLRMNAALRCYSISHIL